MEKIMINFNKATGKTPFNIKMELAETPNGMTTKFAWGEHRFTIEHIMSNCWNIGMEKSDTNEPALLLHNITTSELSSILDQFLI